MNPTLIDTLQPTVMIEAPTLVDRALDACMQALEDARAALDHALLPNLLLAIRAEHERSHDAGFAVCPSLVCRMVASLS